MLRSYGHGSKHFDSSDVSSFPGVDVETAADLRAHCVVEQHRAPV